MDESNDGAEKALKRYGETAVAIMAAVVPIVESAPGTAKIDRVATESDPKIAAAGTGRTKEADVEITVAEQIKSLPLSQLAVP